MPEQVWYSPSEDDYFYKAPYIDPDYTVDWLYIQPFVSEGELPADARRLVPAVIDEAALARAAKDVHERFIRRGFGGYHEVTVVVVEAYLRALGGEQS